MKEVTPAGQVPDEPEVYIDMYKQREIAGDFEYKGLGKNVNVYLDLCFGVIIEQEDLYDGNIPDRLKGGKVCCKTCES